MQGVDHFAYVDVGEDELCLGQTARLSVKHLHYDR